MKSSMIIVGAFIVGCIAGWLGWMPEGDSASRLSLWVLFALMFQVGMGIGSDSRLREILRTISPRMLLVPVPRSSGRSQPRRPYRCCWYDGVCRRCWP